MVNLLDITIFIWLLFLFLYPLQMQQKITLYPIHKLLYMLIIRLCVIVHPLAHQPIPQLLTPITPKNLRVPKHRISLYLFLFITYQMSDLFIFTLFTLKVLDCVSLSNKTNLLSKVTLAWIHKMVRTFFDFLLQIHHFIYLGTFPIFILLHLWFSFVLQIQENFILFFLSLLTRKVFILDFICIVATVFVIYLVDQGYYRWFLALFCWLVLDASIFGLPTVFNTSLM